MTLPGSYIQIRRNRVYLCRAAHLGIYDVPVALGRASIPPAGARFFMPLSSYHVWQGRYRHLFCDIYKVKNPLRCESPNLPKLVWPTRIELPRAVPSSIFRRIPLCYELAPLVAAPFATSQTSTDKAPVWAVKRFCFLAISCRILAVVLAQRMKFSLHNPGVASGAPLLGCAL